MVNKLTYNQMGKALVRFGFEKAEGSNFTAFNNSKDDAIIVLPKGAGTALVRPIHLLTAQKTVVGKGIASTDEFARAINWARRPRLAQNNTDRRVVLRTKTRLRRKPRRKIQSVQTALVIK